MQNIDSNNLIGKVQKFWFIANIVEALQISESNQKIEIYVVTTLWVLLQN